MSSTRNKYRLDIYLPRADLPRLQRRAEQRGSSVSEHVRQLIQTDLDVAEGLPTTKAAKVMIEQPRKLFESDESFQNTIAEAIED